MNKLIPTLALAVGLGLPSLCAQYAESDSGPAAQAVSPAQDSLSASLTVQVDHPGATIQKEIYSHFTEHLGRCIYGGIWVGEDSPIPNTRGIRNDVVAALRTLKVPVIRWPGGCFADEYHWRDGIGPREKRPSMINTHWGGTVENNSFGTHEFFDFIEQVGAEAYISGNVGSGTVQEMMEWVEYMTSNADSPMANLRRANGRAEPWKLAYIGIGNETWGCGGNMRPEYYADIYRRYNTYVKNYPGQKITRIACGASADDYNWTEVLMKGVPKGQMQALSLHYYTLPTGSWVGSKGHATDFDEAAWHTTLRRTLFMEELVVKHAAVMDKFDPQKKIGMAVDEWGTWYDVEEGTNPGWLYQQNTLRDAVVAGLNLNIFHQHADRVTMTAIAQMVNVLQAVILTKDEKMVLTPTYHVMRMYNVHQDATSLPVKLATPDYTFNGQAIPAVSASASKDKNGKVHVSLVNTEPNKPVTIALTLAGFQASKVCGEVLSAEAMNAHNTFDAPEAIKPVSFDGAKLCEDGRLCVELPAKCVVVLELSE